MNIHLSCMQGRMPMVFLTQNEICSGNFHIRESA